MRSFILTSMPRLSERIHRTPVREVNDDASLGSRVSSGALASQNDISDRTEWHPANAEDRLAEAFEQGGFVGWATAIQREVEAEHDFERKKRGYS